jgi:hypothetical protein
MNYKNKSRLKRIYTYTLPPLLIVIFLFGTLLITDTAFGATLMERLKGYILLQVEQNGESWYVHPAKDTRFYLGRPADAFDIMRFQGLGIANEDLNKIPVAGTSWEINSAMRDRVVGRILLQVEENGEAWYVYPENEKRYYLGRPADAFSIMRSLGLGITDNDLDQLTIDPDSMDIIVAPDTPEEEPDDPGWVWDETPPVLENFMVDFGTYNSETGKAGDYDFDIRLEKVFGDFGRTVQNELGEPKILPQMDMFVSSDTDIVSPMDAEVVMVTYQEDTEDYEVHVRPSFNSVWLVNFDHLKNLSSFIVEGANITAGQFLGNPSPWGYFFLIELMITRDLGDGAVGYCPYDFMSSSLKESFESNLDTLMSDWETFKGDTTIYDESAYVKPGCLTSTAPG